MMKTLLLTIIAVVAASAQQVKVAPYFSASAGTASLTTTASTDTSIDWIAEGTTDRFLIPRTDTASKAGFYIGDRTNISAVYIGNCRWSSGTTAAASTWTVVNWAGPFTGPFYPFQVNYFPVNLPVNKFDVMCGRIEWSTPHATNLAALGTVLVPATSCCTNGNGTSAEQCYYTLNEAKPTSLSTASMTVMPSNGCVPIEVWMTRPDIVGLGDSIIQNWDSFASGSNTRTWPQTQSTAIHRYFASNYSPLTYQGMGWGGQTTANIVSRITTDLVNLKPSFVVFNGGVNDVFLNCSTTTGCTGPQITAIESSIQTMLQTAQTNGIKAFIMLIGPWTGNGSDATNAQMTSIDTINANTISIAPTYGATVIDARCAIGQNRPSGPGGNCYDFQAAYLNSDGLGVHPNAAGQQVIANLIQLALRQTVSSGSTALGGKVTKK